ncbi:MAG: hypothetical protein HY319_26515 [Armatimonadetes bacterium]|nr:hypothetical protein [Armatimonadota bacterium]
MRIHLQPRPIGKAALRAAGPGEAAAAGHEDSFLKETRVLIRNWMADGMRSALGVGPRWHMSTRLARKLVADQSLFYLPLTSGMQAPLFDAVRYLGRTHDRESIPQLRNLYRAVARPEPGSRTYSWEGATVTSFSDDSGGPLQQATAQALLEILSRREKREFVAEQLRSGATLKGGTWGLVGEAIRQGMSELAPTLLTQAREARALYNSQLEDFQQGRSSCLSYRTLGNFWWLAAGAWCLAATHEQKAEALGEMVGQYNHLVKSDPNHGGHGDRLMLLLEKEFPEEDRARVLDRLHPPAAQEWERARERWQKYPPGPLFG